MHVCIISLLLVLETAVTVLMLIKEFVSMSRSCTLNMDWWVNFLLVHLTNSTVLLWNFFLLLFTLVWGLYFLYCKLTFICDDFIFCEYYLWKTCSRWLIFTIKMFITIRKYQKHFRMKHVSEAFQTLRKNLAHK